MYKNGLARQLLMTSKLYQLYQCFGHLKLHIHLHLGYCYTTTTTTRIIISKKKLLRSRDFPVALVLYGDIFLKAFIKCANQCHDLESLGFVSWPLVN